MSEWQPIQTNPRDGQWFLAITPSWIGGKEPIALRWIHGSNWCGFVDWDDDSYDDVTHWMPLPSPPPEAEA